MNDDIEYNIVMWLLFSCLDFEIAEGEFERTRQLYERLLDRTKHLKVWISYAMFKASAMEEVEQQEELPEDVLKEHMQQCIKNAR
ncbi:crooked neck-like protein 1, partial [Tanacetum coccineum]